MSTLTAIEAQFQLNGRPLPPLQFHGEPGEVFILSNLSVRSRSRVAADAQGRVYATNPIGATVELDYMGGSSWVSGATGLLVSTTFGTVTAFKMRVTITDRDEDHIRSYGRLALLAAGGSGI